MARKYCPNCKKEVNTHMTGGQIVLFIILFLMGVLPGLLYAMFHAKKCPSCGSRCISRLREPSNNE